MSKGYYGLSFPFRVSSRGGLAMTGSDYLESPHISESIQQILGTTVGERLRSSFGSFLSTAIFEPNDATSHNLIKYEIAQALKQDTRIQVEEDDITVYSEDNYIYADIKYRILDYTNATHETKIKIGGM